MEETKPKPFILEEVKSILDYEIGHPTRTLVRTGQIDVDQPDATGKSFFDMALALLAEYRFENLPQGYMRPPEGVRPFSNVLVDDYVEHTTLNPAQVIEKIIDKFVEGAPGAYYAIKHFCMECSRRDIKTSLSEETFEKVKSNAEISKFLQSFVAFQDFSDKEKAEARELLNNTAVNKTDLERLILILKADDSEDVAALVMKLDLNKIESLDAKLVWKLLQRYELKDLEDGAPANVLRQVGFCSMIGARHRFFAGAETRSLTDTSSQSGFRLLRV